MSTSVSKTGTTTGKATQFEAGSVIFRQDDPAEKVYVITTGHVRLERRVFREAFTMETLGPSNVCGEVALIPESTYTTSAVAVDTVSALVITAEELVTRIKSNTELAVLVARRMATRLAHAHHRIANFSLRSLEARIMLQLTHESERATAAPEGGFTPLPYDLADVLASERGQVDDVLRRLSAEALIELDGAGRFRIVDQAAWKRKVHYHELSDHFSSR